MNKKIAIIAAVIVVAAVLCAIFALRGCESKPDFQEQNIATKALDVQDAQEKDSDASVKSGRSANVAPSASGSGESGTDAGGGSGSGGGSGDDGDLDQNAGTNLVTGVEPR